MTVPEEAYLLFLPIQKGPAICSGWEIQRQQPKPAKTRSFMYLFIMQGSCPLWHLALLSANSGPLTSTSAALNGKGMNMQCFLQNQAGSHWRLTQQVRTSCPKLCNSSVVYRAWEPADTYAGLENAAFQQKELLEIQKSRLMKEGATYIANSIHVHIG